MPFFVYRFLDDNGDVLYVGQTSQELIDRIKGHKHLPKECYSAIREIEYIEFNNGADMALYEIYYINKYRPPYNTLSKFDGEQVSELPEYKWRNFRELYQNSLDDDDLSWKSYKREILDIIIEEELQQKEKRRIIKNNLESLNTAVDMLIEIKLHINKPQINMDDDKFLELMYERDRVPNEFCYIFKAIDKTNYKKLCTGLEIIKEYSHLAIKSDEKTFEFNIVGDIEKDELSKTITITIQEDFLSFIDMWKSYILRNNIKILKELEKCNKNLEIIRRKLSKIYKKRDDDLDYLIKVFDNKASEIG